MSLKAAGEGGSSISINAKIKQAVGPTNSAGFDPWGLQAETLAKVVTLSKGLYTDYFLVKTQGLDQLPAGRCMIVANHSGQLPFDALMASLALILEANPPRLARNMVDYWVPSLPFVSGLMSQAGAVVGSPRNCLDLLEADQCVMVFPEGTRGLGKPYSKRYQLQPFGTGFMRLALAAKAPIVPLAIIGAEDLYPWVYNLKPLAKLLGFPYFPVTPFVPFLGCLGLLPLPCQITLRFGKTQPIEGDPDMSDLELQKLIDQVRKVIQDELDLGLKARRPGIFKRACP